MAKPSIYAILMVSSLLIALQISGNYATKEDAEAESLFQNLCHHRNEKLAKLRFYVQDAVGGPNATVLEVARASITASSPTSFGRVLVFDDPLTATPDRSSEEIGRVQGMVASSDFAINSMATVLNFVFTVGEYNGSTISVLGRNPYLTERRELAVVGGSGAFRFARGYAIESTYSFDEATYYYVQEFNVYATYLNKK